MSRQQQDEYEAWMFGTYNDFANVIKEQGIDNVLEDLEAHFDDVYSALIQAVMERAKINKEKPCLLLQTPGS